MNIHKVFVLVLDAAEIDLVEKWMEDGSLPVLKNLREKGVFSKVESVAEHLSEAVPYTFYSGRNPASHGALGYATWRAEAMQFVPPAPDWLPIKPFWRDFSKDGPRAIVLDVSNIYSPTPFNGIEILGWASHDSLIPFTSYPLEYASLIHDKYGSSHLPDEFYGLLTKKDFLETRQLVIDMTKRFADLCIHLLTREKWNFFLGYTFALHHAGHRLFNTVNITDKLLDKEKTGMDGTLQHVYIEADKMIGKTLQVLDDQTNVMIVSMHGMEISRSRTWILPDMLRLILSEKNNQSSISSFLKWLRSLIPLRWRHQIKLRMPFRVRRMLTRYWRVGYDWKSTKAFTLLSDTHGWIRINLKGREALGIVEEKDYEAILQEITTGLKTFVDEDTAEPIVKDVVRSSQFFSGEKLHRLPDLIIHWADSPSCKHRAVISPQFGRIVWPTPGKNPEGRSGNHKPEGFLFAYGPDIKKSEVSNIHILDLAPTILRLLDQPIPQEMEGKIISFFAESKFDEK
jgi:predicted AlkP superfamily phosphohydrolase/phosphomutase